MSEHPEAAKGSLMVFFAYVLWGSLPLYWKVLEGLGAEVILAHRIIWALVATTGLVVFTRRLPALRSVFSSRRKVAVMVLASLLISANWWLYIWAIGNGHLVEAAMGYYINPLVSVVLGMLVLRERLGLAGLVAFGLAALGVVILALAYGTLPWIALGLAFTFGLYGLLKKQAQVPPLVSLQVETLFSLPLALTFLVVNGTVWGSQGTDPLTVVLLVLAGPLTALPLWLFGTGARYIPLSRVGFLQYVSPTISLLIGVFLFGEAFSGWKVAAFGCIWLGLVVYTAAGLRAEARTRKARSAAA